MRLGYLIVRNDDAELYDGSVKERIKQYAFSVSESALATLGAVGPRITFGIRQQLRATSTPSKLFRELFIADALTETRAIHADISIDPKLVSNTFKNSTLIILIETRPQREIRVSRITEKFSGCRIQCPPDLVEKIMEDVFIDISLGHFFRQQQPLRGVELTGALSRIFALKAKFVKRIGLNRGVFVDGRVPYAPIALLTPREADSEARAQSILADWKNFVASVSDASALGVEEVSRELEAGRRKLAALPRIGGQLPLRRIEEAGSLRSDGLYLLVVLTKSVSVRTNPKFRNHAIALFGSKPRINRSFVLIEEDAFTGQVSNLKELNESGYLSVTRIEIVKGKVWAS